MEGVRNWVGQGALASLRQGWPPGSVEQKGFLGPRKWLGPAHAFLIPPSLSAECPHQEIDVVFLIDGSGSIDRNDFKRMKNFVRAVMDQFKGTHTLVKAGPPRPGDWDQGGSTSGKANLGGGLASLGAGSVDVCHEEARVQGQGMVPVQGRFES